MNRPSSTMRPISSAVEMKSDGALPPFFGGSPRPPPLEPARRAIFQPKDGLVGGGDPPPFGRPAQIRFEREPVGLACAHRRFEHFDAVTADALGVIHRKLGVFEDILG